MVESLRVLKTVAEMVVPSTTRMRGPGMLGALPSSENAATLTCGPSAASGYHRAIDTTRLTFSVSFARVPAGVRLSLGWTSGTSMERIALSPAADMATTRNARTDGA